MMSVLSPRYQSRNISNGELGDVPCQSSSSSFDSFYMEALSSGENENAGPLSPLSTNSAMTRAAGSTHKQEGRSLKQVQSQKSSNHMTVLANGIQKLQAKNQVLECENEKLRHEGEKAVAERQIYISELEHKITMFEITEDKTTKHEEEKETSTIITENPSSDGGVVESSSFGSLISRAEHELQTMLVARHKKIREQSKMLESLTEREGENQRSMELLQAEIDEQGKNVSYLKTTKAKILDQLKAKQASEVELSSKYEESVKTCKDLQIALSDKDFMVAELGKELDVSLRIKDSLKRRREKEGDMDVPCEIHESKSFGSLLSMAEKKCIALSGTGNETTVLQKLLVSRNRKIKEQTELLATLTTSESEHNRSVGLLRAKIDEQDLTITNMNYAKVEILDQLDARRAAEVDLNAKWQASIEAHEKTIKQCKDLEIVLADKNFLVAELGKELDVAHRMTDDLRKKFEQDKQSLDEKHEKEIASLCKNRMVAVEARVKKEVEDRLNAKHVVESNTLSQELRDVKQANKDLQLQLSDESFKKDEACRQLRDMSFACEEMVEENKRAADARRKVSEPRLAALKHDTERELQARYEAKMQALESTMETQDNKIRELKLKQFEVPEEVQVLQKQLDEAREKLALLCRNNDESLSVVTSGNNNCMNELITSLDEIKTSLFFSNSNRLEAMTVTAINEARDKVRDSVNKMDETLKVCCIVEEMNRDRVQTQRQIEGDGAISVSSIHFSRQSKSPTRNRTQPDEDVSLNSLTREWDEYNDTKRKVETSKMSIFEKEVGHLATKLRENTFLLGGCYDGL